MYPMFELYANCLNADKFNLLFVFRFVVYNY